MDPEQHRATPRVAAALRWTLLAISLVLLAAAGWIRFRFGAVTLEQILLNLPTQGGGEAGDPGLVAEGAWVCLGVPAGVLLLALSAGRRRRRRVRPSSRRALVLSTLAFTVALGLLLEVVGVPEYASAVLGNRSIGPYYVRPDVAGTPERPRNLITIYLESGENAYADASLFGENLLDGLDEATSGWARYDGLRQYPGGGWTMSGLVATACGIPLKSQLLVDGMNLNNFGEEVTSYLPGARCLGDILSDHGYTNVFLGGAHSRFAGKDTFLTGHGYDRVEGLAEWEEGGESRSEISAWGLSDHRLLARAAGTVDALHAAGAPFNLTLLTLDTHEPGGVFPSCAADEEPSMKAAVKCSMRAVARFLGHLEKQGYLDDTVVVVMGDHLKATSEGGSFKPELERTPDRTIIYRAWSPDPIAFGRERADQLSVLPSTLELLGFAVPGGRAGVGVSFVNPHSLSGTAPGLPDDDYRAVLTSPSTEVFAAFWGRRER